MSISNDRDRIVKLAKKADKDINYSDIPELDDNFWENAKPELPKSKKPMSLRVDADVLEWFKKHGKGYQTLINSILKSYMKSHKQ